MEERERDERQTREGGEMRDRDKRGRRDRQRQRTGNVMLLNLRILAVRAHTASLRDVAATGTSVTNQ